MTYMFAIYNNIIYYLVCGQLGTWYYIIRFTNNINDEKKKHLRDTIIFKNNII